MLTSRTLAASARLALLLLAGASLAACATMEPRYPSRGSSRQAGLPPGGAGERKVGQPYQVGGVWYVPREQPNYDEVGIASWYGDAFNMKPTANGEIFDMNAVSAAHTTLPLPSLVEVTNLENGRKLVVRVNDRGPFVGDRILDLSHEAARQLGSDRAGLAKVRVRYLGPAPLVGPADGYRVASNGPLPIRLAAATPAPAPRPMAAAAPMPRTASDPVMELAAGGPAAPAAMAAPRPTTQAAPATAPVTAQALAPVTGSEILATPIPPPGPVTATPILPPAAPVAAAPAMPLRGTLAAAPSNLRIQAGAFASEANAQQAASRLVAAGPASVEAMQRADGMTLYRVILPAPADEDAAYALRDRVAEYGFADARVVRTF